MYNYTRAYVKEKNHWSEKDISGETLVSVMNTYDNVRVIATYDVETAERGIDFRNNRYALSLADKSLTITAWLAVLDPLTVSHDNTFVSFNEVQCMKHYNLFDTPLTAKGGNANYGEGVQIPKGLIKDLQITSTAGLPSEWAIENISKNGLFAINGRFCFTRFESGRAFIIDAYEKSAPDKRNILSVVDFTDVGGLTQVNIEEDMVDVFIRNNDDIEAQVQRVTVTMPEAVPGTTPILVLDGHMHVLDGRYRRIDGKRIAIDIHLPTVLKRASNNKNYQYSWIDSANVRQTGLVADTIDVKKFLHQTDSFIAFVHTENLCIFKEPLIQTQTYGGYEHYRAPKGIILNEMSEYMPHIYQEVDEDHLSINVGDNRRMRRFYDTVNFDKVGGFSNNAFTWGQREFMNAYAFEVYTF